MTDRPLQPRAGPLQRRAGPLQPCAGSAVAISICAFVAACGGTTGDGARAIQTLTTGVIELEIGVVEGDPEYQFSNLHVVETLPDGAIFVADIGTRELGVYEADGRHRWTAGGHGDAPGEFSFMTWAAHDDAHIMAWDLSSGRLLLFALADGEFLESVRIPGLESFSWVWGRFSDGTVLALIESPRPPDVPGGLLPNDGQFVRAGPESDPKTLVDFEGAPWADVGGLLQQTPLTVRAVGVVRGDTVWLMLPADRGYRVISPDGAEKLVVGDSTVRVLTDEIRDAYRDAQLAAASTRQRARLVDRLETIDLLETLPTYDAMVVGIDRRVWLRRFEASPGGTALWDVFSPEGVLAARAALPTRFTLTEAGPDYVLGVWKDELDVSYVRRYTLMESQVDRP